LLDKIEQVNRVLTKISEDLMTMKGSPVPPPGQEAKEKTAAPVEKKPTGQKTEPPAPETKTPAAPTNSLSPQEFYNTATPITPGATNLAATGSRSAGQFSDARWQTTPYWIECLFPDGNSTMPSTSSTTCPRIPQGDRSGHYLKGSWSSWRKDEALVVFKLLMSKYPLEEEARIAQEKIKELSAK
jgi:hypothetical protein